MTTETEELPPLWALDKAAKECGHWPNWLAVAGIAFSAARDSIIAHARTIAKHEPAPPPHQRERGELARLLRFMNMKSAAYQVESGGGQDGLLGEYLAILKERGL